ncbi:MAG: hypothetical protein KatS3mg111_3826 [Pirellulaceae bacterium]|nr:MAG: hypothetical protein KatS3mg111_3826 [Pirellulaceae bacterium]
MRTLILMRHAKSDWSQPGLADYDRPLNRRGRRAAPAMAHLLEKHHLRPEVILTSTARRTQETLELMRATGWAPDAIVINEKQLYLASPETILECISALDNHWSNAMVMGHNPGLAQLVQRLAGQEMELPTAAVVVFSCDAEDWPTAGRGSAWKLLHYWKPRDLEPSDA